MSLWVRESAFVSTGDERLWIHSGSRKIRFDRRRSLEKSPAGKVAQMTQCLRAPLLQFPLSSASTTASELLAEMIQPHRILQSGLDHNPKFSLGPHKIISIPNHQQVA